MANQVEKQQIEEQVVQSTENVASEKAMKRGTIIQAVKAIAVLVCICLVCGALLALCNDLFYVTDEVKFDRAMQKIYPQFSLASDSPELVQSGASTPYGTVLNVYKSSDGAFVIESQSNGVGFSGGNVTLYVAISSGAEPTIVGWAIKASDKQSFVGNISANHQKTWHIGQSITQVQPTVSPDKNEGKGSGATYTENAIANAINTACYYAINTLKLVSTPESEAKDAIAALLADKADGYSFVAVSDSAYLEANKVDDKALSFYFEGTKDGANTLAVYVYGEDDNRQIVVVDDSLTHTERLQSSAVIAKSEGIADNLVAKAQSRSYFEYQIQQSYASFEYAGMAEINGEFATQDKGSVSKVYMSTDGAVVIQATGNEGFEDGTVTINVIIADSQIKGWSIVSSKDQSFIGNILGSWNTVKEWFVNESIDTAFSTVTPDTDKGHGTGATYSENAITNAVNVACNYARNTLQQGGTE